MKKKKKKKKKQSDEEVYQIVEEFLDWQDDDDDKTFWRRSNRLLEFILCHKAEGFEFEGLRSRLDAYLRQGMDILYGVAECKDCKYTSCSRDNVCCFEPGEEQERRGSQGCSKFESGDHYFVPERNK